jgi:site-specific DNA-methyltransferase (adenine-specific)
MKYRVIYLDPPWLYNDARTHRSTGMALSAYPCLSVEELCKLPIGDLADKDCMLCCWATGPKTPEAIRCIESWGFTYLTKLFTWVKLRPNWTGPTILPSDIYSGLGHYTNSNTEYVLLGRRGKSWRERRDVKEVIFAPRGSHSAKPPEVRTRIEDLFGNVPRIEVFSREVVSGWDCLGNAIDGKDIREALVEQAAA